MVSIELLAASIPTARRLASAAAAVAVTTAALVGSQAPPIARAAGPGTSATIAARGLTTVAAFDPARGQLAENLAVDREHGVWVTLVNAGIVRRIEADGTVRDYPIATAGGNITGVAFDAAQRPHVAVASPDPSRAGIWRLDTHARAFTRVAALPTGRFGDPTGTLPNGISFDRRGTLYIADSYQGQVFSWRPGQSKARVWARSSLLAPDPANAIGGLLLPAANGLKVYRDRLYVSNPNKATFLSAPLRGSRARLFGVHLRGIRLDDFAFDVAGDLYGATILTETIERITPAGDRTVLATKADGLDGPSAVAFDPGISRTDRARPARLYVTNVAIVSPNPKPSLQYLRVPLPGAPLGR